ncbi:MAG: hypothetical protein R3D00_17355 [Bacteroidia bacterium]
MQIRLLFIALFVLGLFFSCGNEKEKSDDQSTADSLLPISAEDSLIMESPVTTPGLLGKWQLTEMKTDNGPITDFGESTIEFLANGDLIAESDQVPAETFGFSEDGTFIRSELWDSPLRIKTLDESQLILTENISGEQIQYKYLRK